MAELVLAAPGDFASRRTGGYRYDVRVLAELSARRHAATALALPEDFPEASAASVRRALDLLALAPKDATLVVDGLAYGALPVDGIRALGRPVVALVHHPLALETGLSAETAARLERSEREALAAASLVIATSEATRETLMTAYDISPAKVRVAEPGVDPAKRAKGGDGETPVVLSVGTVSPRKNHVALATALGRLADIPWRWKVVGSLRRYPSYVEELRAAIEAAGVTDRVELLGDVADAALADAYDRADLFALPSHLEGYGMAHAEALARGLPVVAGDGPAAAALLTERCGALVPPADLDALTEALRRLLSEPSARSRAASAARTRAARLPRWFQCADVFEHVMTHPLPA